MGTTRLHYTKDFVRITKLKSCYQSSITSLTAKHCLFSIGHGLMRKWSTANQEKNIVRLTRNAFLSKLSRFFSKTYSERRQAHPIKLQVHFILIVVIFLLYMLHWRPGTKEKEYTFVYFMFPTVCMRYTFEIS